MISMGSNINGGLIDVDLDISERITQLNEFLYHNIISLIFTINRY